MKARVLSVLIAVLITMQLLAPVTLANNDEPDEYGEASGASMEEVAEEVSSTPMEEVVEEVTLPDASPIENEADEYEEVYSGDMEEVIEELE